MKNKFLLFLCQFFIIGISLLYGQQPCPLTNGVCSRSVSIQGNIANGSSLQLPVQLVYPYRIDKISIKFTLDFVEEIGNTDFGVSCNFSTSFPNNLGNSIELKKNKTIGVKSFDILPNQITSLGQNISVDITQIQSTIADNALTTYLSDRLRATLSLDIHYGIDVNGISTSGINQSFQSIQFEGKTAKFKWNHTGYSPNYQLQILKLYNFDSFDASPVNIKSKINWDDALTIETQTDKKEIGLTISEGTGFYLWRFRPIGNYYENGVANVKNHGKWSNAGLGSIEDLISVSVSIEQTSSIVNFDKSDANNKTFNGFFYKDKDENLNYIYGRTFTEKSGVSEKISYATTLQQTKQNQTYLPSKGNTVTSQTVYDHSGRPTLNSLPVPQDAKGLEGYKNKFMTTADEPNRPYKAEDFDNSNKIKNPSIVNNQNFDYYTGKNNVASAEGYVFSRVLYDNDGTGKVKEQSGVGKKHSIAPENDPERGKTTITKYDKATPTELLRLFGNEAPNHESVIKVITFDPNGTGSITYTSKEGKTIATCLYAKQTSEELDDLNSIENTLMLKDILTANTSSNNKIVSSRTLNLIQDSPLNLKYSRDCNNITGTSFPLSICKYDLNVVIAFTDANLEFPTSFQVPNNWALSYDRKVLTSNAYDVRCTANIVLTSIPNLPKGSYFIEKQLTPQASNAAAIAEMEANLRNSTMPLVNMISDWLDGIKCSKDIPIFYNKVELLEKGLQGKFTFSATGQFVDANNSTLPLTNGYYTNLHNYYASQLKVNPITTDGGIPYFSTKPNGDPTHKVKLIKHLCIDISTPTCALLRIAIPMNLSMDLNTIKLQALPGLQTSAGVPIYKVNPMMFLDEILKDYNPNFTTKTQFYPDIEGYSYGYLWENVPNQLETILGVLNKQTTQEPKLKGTFDYIKGDLSLSNSIQNFGGDNIVNLITLFKNKYQMHFPDNAFLNLSFPGTLENPNQPGFVKDFLKVNANTEFFGTLNMEQITALKIIYIHYVLLRPYMEGWEVPGTLDLMSYKMLTDNYTTDGFTHDDPNNQERKLIYDGPRPRKDDCGEYISLYSPNPTSNPNIPVIPNENYTQLISKPQYYAVDIIKAWEAQLSAVKVSASLGSIPEITNGSGAVQNGQGQNGIFGYIAGLSPQNIRPRPVQSFDNQAGSNTMADHINSNIRLPWYAKLLGAKRRIRRRIEQAVRMLRAMQLPPAPGGVAGSNGNTGTRWDLFANEMPPLTQEEIDELNEIPYFNPKYNYHMVIEMLNITGFKFAKILTPYDPKPLPNDEKPTHSYNTVDPDNYAATPDNWQSFDGTNRNYEPNRYWRKKYELDPINGNRWIVEYPEIDPAIWLKGIYDPVYAFKYFEYHGNGASINPTTGNLIKDTPNAYRLLEIQNCLYDYSRNNIQENTSPIPNNCNICMVGKIECSQTSKNWSSGQRMAFYMAYRSYIKDNDENFEFDSDIVNVTAPGYFTEIVMPTNPISTKTVFRLWEKGTNNALVDYFLDGTSPNQYTTLYNNGNGGFKKPDGTRFKTLVELELDNYNKNIEDVCNAREADLRAKLLQMLSDKCYILVDCIPAGLSADQKKKYVLRADIDKIVQAMKDECKNRGKITSFRTYKQPCQYAYWMVNPPPFDPAHPERNLNNGDMPVLEYGTKPNTTASSDPYNVHQKNVVNGSYSVLPDEVLKLKDGTTLIENMSVINEVNGVVTFTNPSLLSISMSCEWTRREQTLKLDMKMDMPCVCNPSSNCTPALNSEEAFCDCVGVNCGGTTCLPRRNTPPLQSVNGNNIPKIKTEVIHKIITIPGQ